MSQLYFVEDPERAWVPASKIGVRDTAKGQMHDLQTVDGNKVSISDKQLAQCDTVSQSELDSILPNLIDLESFSEGIILHQCNRRFSNNDIYTFVGSILVAVNPFQRLNIYTEALMHQFKSAVRNAASEPLKPHVFAVSALALENMVNDRKSQSVLISGESGAGKTETTKKILEYLAHIAGKEGAGASGPNVAQQILQSNPVLESFGNAKTGRNNNSSRFGKWMELNLVPEGTIQGCRIVNYLLEKSRVVLQIKGERSYHVFYMMLADPDLRKKLSLKAPEQYHYLNQSGCVTVDGRDDYAEQKEMLTAMRDLCFPDALQQDLFKALAGILNLGNVSFGQTRGAADSGGGNAVDSVSVTEPGALKAAAELLGIDLAVVDQALCFRRMTTKTEGVINIPLTAIQAQDQRDALSKEIYRQIFDMLVRRVNESIYKGATPLTIGVLDIYGFELFEVNSFEQLCINYANEKLQFFFNAIVFDAEMSMYRSEGIDCAQIVFQDNQECLDLIEKKTHGILAKLDEELVVPSGSDKGFCDKCISTYDKKHRFFKASVKNANDFVIVHFAGEVTYRTDGFLEKNKDALADVLTSALEKSTNPVVKDMFLYSAMSASESSSGGAGTTPTKRDSGGSGSLNKPTIAKQFKSNLDTLMTALQQTAPHFIRCVKSNSKQKPSIFEAPLCLRQLKYAGLFEAIRIRKAGYAYRFPHDFFVRKYYLTCSNKAKMVDREYAVAILEELSAKSGGKLGARDVDWAVGNSKVFIKSKVPRVYIEEQRNKSIAKYVVKLQAFCRMGLAKLHTFAAKFEIAKRKKEIERLRREEEERKKAHAEKIRLEKEEKEKKEREEREERERKEKEERERKEKEEAERLRIEAIQKARLAKAVGKIQGICRIFHAKRTAKALFACRLLQEAIYSRENEFLVTAIKSSKHAASFNSKVRSIIEHAREVLNEVVEEHQVRAAIEEAIERADVTALRAAIQLAASRHLSGTPEAMHAEKLLQTLIARDKALERVIFLTSCGDQNTVLENADELRAAIDDAKKLGVTSEAVRDAEDYYVKLQVLLPIRNKMRVAVELGSRKLILEGLEERREFCKVHGPDFCREELTAMKNMLRMFSFEVQLKGGDNITPPPPELEGQHEDEGMRLKSFSREDASVSDIRLPRWAFERFRRIQLADDEEERNFELKLMQRLLGSAEKLKEIRRVYKWVCQYSTWRHPDHEEMISRKFMAMGLDEEEAHNMTMGMNKFRSTIPKTPKKELAENMSKLQSGSASRDREVRKEATFVQKKKSGSSGYGQKGGGGGEKGAEKQLPRAEKKLQEMMKEYSAFYDTHRTSGDWCP